MLFPPIVKVEVVPAHCLPMGPRRSRLIADMTNKVAGWGQIAETFSDRRQQVLF